MSDAAVVTVICIIVFIIASLIKHKGDMEQLEIEEHIFRLRAGLPPESEDEEEHTK